MSEAIRADYHLHTEHSMDCNMPLTTLCEAAVREEVQEICITNHTEFGHPDPEADVPPVMPDLLREIEGARETFPMLTIRLGMEIGDNPRCRDSIKAWHDRWPLDFRLLSLHLIDNADPYSKDFFTNLEMDQTAFYRRYVESKLESALAWVPDSFDSLAHLGYCAKFAPYPMEERPLRWKHAPDAFDALFTYLAQNGKALEINTSGHRSMGECIPDRELVSRFCELGGEFVTIGSDAHRPEHVGLKLDVAMELARDCGIRYQATFDQRRLIPKRL